MLKNAKRGLKRQKSLKIQRYKAKTVINNNVINNPKIVKITKYS